MPLLEHRRNLPSMKRLYNWFYKFYGLIERSLSRSIEEIVKTQIKRLPDASNKTALEYACGSGILSLYLAGIFKSFIGRDLSMGMINRAMKRAEEAGIKAVFIEGNILEPDEKAKSYDYVFVSFALHLFAPEIEKEILIKLLYIAREAVVIIEHQKKWRPFVALTEWLEGSYYDLFIKTDFARIAQEIGASGFKELEIADSTYMIFYNRRY